ncbi:hypothetical protein [Nonomuraea endophytica]|uniref:Uncharacterized protein n=1 Tax=Nonomuraea endophytica TaxID=714136 RepID=A0A7W8A4J3_9ACTN|nr:hypothetical protein [Nonomuraea endophytica]MBB5078710.1 hypothetical protein [Nonomuraea endophytica]
MRGEDEFLHELESEVEVELTATVASRPEEEYALPITEWLFDPTDVEREQIGLRGVLDAIDVLEHEERPDGIA